MSRRRSIRSRRVRKRITDVFDLQLTSMLDILVIILVFLLKTYQANTSTLAAATGLDLPFSISEDVPQNSLSVIVTKEAITFEKEKITDLEASASEKDPSQVSYSVPRSLLDEGGLRIAPLYDALKKARENSELLRAKSQARDDEGEPLPFDGIILIQADKEIHYGLLRKVMYTAGAAGFKMFRLAAQKKPQ